MNNTTIAIKPEDKSYNHHSYNSGYDSYSGRSYTKGESIALIIIIAVVVVGLIICSIYEACKKCNRRVVPPPPQLPPPGIYPNDANVNVYGTGAQGGPVPIPYSYSPSNTNSTIDEPVGAWATVAVEQTEKSPQTNQRNVNQQSGPQPKPVVTAPRGPGSSYPKNS